ncbi:cellulose biosynthesis protein BcsS [Paraburkholderia phymatum]|nr:cellulose biosynthesis protein BcsS [Paraburkholderia phymatum]
MIQINAVPSRLTRPFIAVASILAAALFSGSQPATAASLIFGGATIAGQGERNEFIGETTPLFSSQYVIQRLALSDYYYQYGKNGETVKVHGEALDGALGLQTAWQQGWFQASAGVHFRNNRVSPDGADAKADGSQFGLSLGVQGEERFGNDWSFGGIGVYTVGPASYWTRVRLLHRAFGTAWAGVEFSRHGDPNYHTNQGGLVLTGIRIGTGLDLGFYTGVKKTTGQSRSFYGGVEVTKSF